MFLCALDGKIYDNTYNPQLVILKTDTGGLVEDKELSIDICPTCYGDLCHKYYRDDFNKFRIKNSDKIKIYRISSVNFSSKIPDLDKDDNNMLLNNVLKQMKKCEKKACKK